MPPVLSKQEARGRTEDCIRDDCGGGGKVNYNHMLIHAHLVLSAQITAKKKNAAALHVKKNNNTRTSNCKKTQGQVIIQRHRRYAINCIDPE